MASEGWTGRRCPVRKQLQEGKAETSRSAQEGKEGTKMLRDKSQKLCQLMGEEGGWIKDGARFLS